MPENRVLVVDDDQDIREMVGLVIGEAGCEVVAARDGLDALELLASGPRPTLILLDLMLPRMSGVDFLKVLAADRALGEIPVVIMSGDAAAEETARASGASGCLVKPMDIDELLSTVEYFAPHP